MPREHLKLSAADYLERGTDFASRTRPEDQDEALRLFDKALDIDPNLPAAHAGIARVSTYLYTLGIDPTPRRIATAVDEGRAAVGLAPGSASAHAALGLALAAHDKLTPALEEARRAAALDPRSAEAQVALGVILRLERRIDESLVACHRAAGIEPGSPRVLVALAESLREAERYSEAIEMYGQAIDLDHEAVVPQLGAAATWQKGGNTETARRLYSLILEKWDFAKSRVRLGLASLFVASEDYERAISLYGQIEVPDDASMPAILALYGKGYSLLRLGRDAEAEYFLSTLVDRVPRNYDGPARGREFLFRAYEDLADYFGKRGRERKVES
ncbi:MAG TPA: tetratricopeptide repeat protein, partial [Candidatus Polarisedimenticolia bacterium]|nr:tetratricopeptide repeat protein [Candidatus Polarisedimenticolia bacterium]